MIELLIALVVAGILVAIAFPSFLDSMRKSRRSDAIAHLNAVQQAQERFRANSASYSSSLTNAASGTPPGLGLSSTTGGSYYTVSLEGVSATGYSVVATAVAGKSQANDSSCARLRVRSEGGNLLFGSANLSGSFTEGTSNSCWNR